jgi:hypothetical protein
MTLPPNSVKRLPDTNPDKPAEYKLNVKLLI